MNKGWLKTTLLAFLLSLVFLVPAEPGGKNAISYNKDGWNYLRKGDHLRAVVNFKNALKQNPRYMDSLIGLGKAYNEVGAYEQAVGLFSDALKLKENSDQALTGMGFALLGLGRTKQALDSFSRAVDASGENLEAHYGIAYLYYLMGKKLWSERKAESVLKINRYHIGSLLLMADIKSSEGRFEEARTYCRRAIEGDSDNPAGYISCAGVLLREYLKGENNAAVAEAIDSLNRALSIQPESFQANRIMGTISLLQEQYGESIAYYKKALSLHAGPQVMYNLAVAYDRSGSQESALESFLRAYEKSPSDSILRSRMENFLVYRDYEIGHPARVLLGSERYQTALENERKNLPGEAVLSLRRTIFLNPMNRDARERLMRYYDVLGYKRFYLDELKDMNRLYPESRYQERLTAEIIKRRDALYHREGYSDDEPPRDVPVVLVFNFDTDAVSTHADAGSVLAGGLTFTLGQFGRMKTLGERYRAKAVKGAEMKAGFEKALEDLSLKIKDEDLPPVDYIVYGHCTEEGKGLSAVCNLMDFHKGIIINTVELSESGKDALTDLCLRLARRIYDVIPFKGRILKLKDTGIIVNLGLFDGINAGSILMLQKIPETDQRRGLPQKVYFSVKEADTLVSYAEPMDKKDLELVDSSDVVFPQKRRRARMIE